MLPFDVHFRKLYVLTEYAQEWGKYNNPKQIYCMCLQGMAFSIHADIEMRSMWDMSALANVNVSVIFQSPFLCLELCLFQKNMLQMP